MTQETFSNIATTIPHQPGIYKYFDDTGKILYVGKAKDLRKRVSSYFNKTFTNYKTHELVQRIEHIEFTIVNSEPDAFFLENALIKQFQPKYNINLKDSKSYPYIVIKNEPFPRIYLTRQPVNDGSEYLGPYTSVFKVRELLEFIKRTIPMRTCSLNLSARNIEKGKYKVCLEYHLGNCKGPCAGLQTREDYDANIGQIRDLLKGNLGPVIRHFKEEMRGHAEALEFEKAEQVRKKIEYLEDYYQSKSVITGIRGGDKDVFSIIKDQSVAYVNYLMIRNGTVVQTQTNKLETHLDEPVEEILVYAVSQLRMTFNSQVPEIIVPFEIDYPEAHVEIMVPKAGDRKKLLELSEKNAGYFIEELRNKERIKINRNVDHVKVLEQLQIDLQLQELPVHIECFDNSNFQGSYPVSAMVCFKNGVPSKKDYRHFNVKTVEGINDFASMKEAVYRRYKRLTEEQQALPQLVIIDGGKGQLGAALEAMEALELQGSITLVGLAKNVEEIFFAGDKESLKLPYSSSSLKLIRFIRDQVHRFGITFHRQKRSKGTFKNELESIKGIGKNTADELLKEFRSVKNVKERSLDELAAVVGKVKAQLVIDHFSS
ncbi:excinuclease ABC subunit UvrC [Niabella drilacis]|uniref:UvrABC system protein C n=1 Tax=Niabella drilacis (strain DSM 25811 / CCM 8410 / CCUG 62505 / LMG 26954 / E90) TaxID=1285928 RepID=A0A1G6Z4P8_NIADE|nr:excinuclease ABC subunit UvrC [Niabella drilacis]SDD97462.1 Excinuclease ABC subunit C [Niabella drilacis]